MKFLPRCLAVKTKKEKKKKKKKKKYKYFISHENYTYLRGERFKLNFTCMIKAGVVNWQTLSHSCFAWPVGILF